MARIANIAAKLSLDTKGFSTAMQRAKKATKQFAGDMGRIGLQVGKFGAAAGAVAAGGLALMVKSQTEVIARTQRVADRINESTKALSRLQYAAAATGASTDRMQEGLTEMVQRLGEAQTGTGSAADGLRMIGLEAAKLAGMKPAEAFGQIADAINRLPSQSDRLFAIDEIFGGDGRELINLINLGSEGIARLGQEADKLGASFNEVDARQVIAATEAMNRVKAGISGIGTTLAIEVAPFITSAADKLLELGNSGEGMGSRVIGAFEWVSKAIAGLMDWLELGRTSFYSLQSGATWAVFGMVKAIDKLAQGIAWLLNKLGLADVEVPAFFNEYARTLEEEAQKAWDRANESFDRFAMGANSQAVNDLFDQIRADAQASAEAIAANAGQMNAAADAAERFVNGLEESNASASKIADVLDKLRRDIDTFGMSEDEKTLFDLKALGATNEQLEEARQLMEQLRKLEEQAEIDRLAAMELEPFQPKELSYTLAGSAEAQRLAYQAARGIEQRQDDTPKKQLDVQKRMARSLENIERQGGTGGGASIVVQEWGI